MGSETIKTYWLGGETHCTRCGMQFTNIDKQVAEAYTVYPSRRREVICYSCRDKRVDEARQRP